MILWWGKIAQVLGRELNRAILWIGMILKICEYFHISKFCLIHYVVKMSFGRSFRTYHGHFRKCSEGCISSRGGEANVIGPILLAAAGDESQHRWRKTMWEILRATRKKQTCIRRQGLHAEGIRKLVFLFTSLMAHYRMKGGVGRV